MSAAVAPRSEAAASGELRRSVRAAVEAAGLSATEALNAEAPPVSGRGHRRSSRDGGSHVSEGHSRVSKSASAPSMGSTQRRKKASARKTLSNFIQNRSFQSNAMEQNAWTQSTWEAMPSQPPAALERARAPEVLENYKSRKNRFHMSNYQSGNAWYTEPEMVESVERQFGPGQPHLSDPNQSTVQIGSMEGPFGLQRGGPVKLRLREAELNAAGARMEMEQRESMARQRPVPVSQSKLQKLIVPFTEFRPDYLLKGPRGTEGALQTLAPLFPQSAWRSDYRAHMSMDQHEARNTKRLDSVPARARPCFTHHCLEPNSVRPGGTMLVNQRVIGMPPHNPNNRASPM